MEVEGGAVSFPKEMLGRPYPWEKQEEILRAVSEHNRVAVRSGHGVGKTWASARCVLWYLYCHRGVYRVNNCSDLETGGKGSLEGNKATAPPQRSTAGRETNEDSTGAG